MNQNLFRQFLYVASSPIGNWLSFSGNLIREAGPFTDQDLHSRDFSGAVDFRVGRPWGKTALLTGYSGRDLLFGPSVYEYYQTVSYAGLEHTFGSRIRASAVAEFLRAWRVQGASMRSRKHFVRALELDAKIKEHWTLTASGAWSSGRSFHAYDNVTSSVMVSYTRERGWNKSMGSETASVAYPMRFSFGLSAAKLFTIFPGRGTPKSFRRRSSLFDVIVSACADLPENRTSL